MFFLTLIGLGYIGSMLFYAFGFLKIQTEWEIEDLEAESKNFTVVIPFRNESASLPAYIRSIVLAEKPAITTPVFIFVNDHSDDDSIDTLEEELKSFPYPYQIVLSKGKGKKAALSTGIEMATTEWILTNDADVQIQKRGLASLCSLLYHTHADLLVLPVQMKGGSLILGRLQSLESNALVAMALGSLANGVALTANGANLAFKKEAFYKWGGYEPEINRASGDDEFLLKRAFAQNPEKVAAIASREFCVYTQPMEGMSELVNQRVRWASKIKWYGFSASVILSSIGVLFMLVFAFCLAMALFFGNYTAFISCLAYKFIGDGLLYLSFARFFELTRSQLLLLLIMPFYQISYMLWVGIKKIGKKYEWKERTYPA